MTDTTLHLGNITQPLLIFGGPYSNLQSLQAIKATAERLSIPPERCICTGDIVAYCAQPKETVALIREWGVHCLMGNCEESLAIDSEDCGCGFEEGTHCDLLSSQWFQFSKQQLGEDERTWFSLLPRNIRFSINNIEALVVHGSVLSINEFIFESMNDQIFTRQFDAANADLIIAGHCGMPFTKKLSNKIWHNAGAVGMPANSGTTQTWFSIIEANNEGLTIERAPLAYDHQSAYTAMQTAKLNNAYAEALLSGLWPSTDVLPNAEKTKKEISPCKEIYNIN
jgi:predicted phosphodiesterase